jgi:SOS regulatory protein LexA
MLGDNISRIRKSRKMSINKLSEKSGISLGYISDLENNKLTNPSYEKLELIAKVLNTTIGELVEEVVLYDANSDELSDITKVAPLVIDALRRAAGSDPELAQAVKETIKSQNKIFYLSNLIKKVMYNAINDDLHIEFNDNNEYSNMNLNNKVKEVVENFTPTFLTKIESHTIIPILGVIRAGEPMYAEQNIIEKMPIPDNQLNHGGEYFGLLVNGDSMNNSTIVDGSYIIVRKQEEVENGEIAVVLVNGENATIKIFYRTDSTVTLIPNSSNPDHKPRMIDLSKTDVKILGKVMMTINKL